LALSCYLRTVRDDVRDLLPGRSAELAEAKPGPADLDSSELVLLQRLLGPDAGTAGYSAATPG
jgi:hypothetical protein